RTAGATASSARSTTTARTPWCGSATTPTCGRRTGTPAPGSSTAYTHTRSLPELQPLLGSTHHYATWDDHDYGPNNSDRSWWNRRTTLEAFRLFWGNPAYGVDGNPGITSTFRWADVQVFLLDDRYHRTPNGRVTGKRTMLGEEQIRWLVDALVSSDATFKLVALGGQFLNPYAAYETYANLFPAERERILERLRQEDVPGVVFLSGDRHFTELTRLERPGSYPLYDLTVSPLTSSAYAEGDEEPNDLRVSGTAVTERNYAVLRFSGPRKDRRMTISVRDVAGKEVWSRTIRASDLR
ncbi:MAG: alkaline phosphatase, partial [Gemmatimonadota bacterium]